MRYFSCSWSRLRNVTVHNRAKGRQESVCEKTDLYCFYAGNPVNRAEILCQSFDPALCYLCHVHVALLTRAVTMPPTQSAIMAQNPHVVPLLKCILFYPTSGSSRSQFSNRTERRGHVMHLCLEVKKSYYLSTASEFPDFKVIILKFS